MTAHDKHSDQPEIDFGKLDYPSDALTLKDLRRLFPQGFQGDELHPEKVSFFGTSVSDDFSTKLDFERMVAGYAFDEALGRPLREGTFTGRGELREYLEEFYIGCGIAKGPQHARQLIRELEESAANQARQHISVRRL